MAGEVGRPIPLEARAPMVGESCSRARGVRQRGGLVKLGHPAPMLETRTRASHASAFYISS